MWAASDKARAEQFIAVDVTYTHAADTTTDSHYYVDPSPSTPANWKAPVDYASGSVHVLLQVKTKPTNAPTRFQVCFEGTPQFSCTDQSPVYTTTGEYEWTTAFSNFYQPSGVDWSKGVKRIPLILKDTNNNKPQGDPQYVPTDLRVEVAVLSPGAKYMKPTQDAGAAGDAGANSGPVDAGAEGPHSDAGATAPAATDAATGATLDAGRAPTSGNDDARAPAVSHDAGAASDAGAPLADAGDDSEAKHSDSDSGCSTGRGDLQGSLALMTLVALASRRKVRHRRARALSLPC
ncbi:MAG TPA: hypothetical protein VG963_07520 [Polyangiaceae bacterium]|nr:hypothetical protein [Polyangiaceae bacterium]